jgi:hypothetical protein
MRVPDRKSAEKLIPQTEKLEPFFMWDYLYNKPVHNQQFVNTSFLRVKYPHMNSEINGSK